MNINVYEKLSFEKFDLNYFMQLHEFDECLEEGEFDFSPLRNIDAIHLESIFIKENFKRKGYGKKFVDELKKQAKPIILYSTIDAEEFWIKQGFQNHYSYIYTWGIDFNTFKKEDL